LDWLNLHISTIDSPEATICDPVRRATWVWLLRFCIGQENGGRIENCGTWGDTTWQQMAKVRLREVRAESTLWHWDGDALVVHFYPVEKEAEVQAKRTGGTYGGKAATEAKAQAARENGKKGGRPKTQAETQAPETQEPKLNPTEWNGKERKGKEAAATAAACNAAAAPENESPFDGEPTAVTRVLSAETFMEWKNKYLRFLGINPARGAGVGDWADLFNRHGWSEMCKAADYLISVRKDPSHKIWPDQFAKLEKRA
jgi:uncharacterized protein YdaU (DUF1376 family)